MNASDLVARLRKVWDFDSPTHAELFKEAADRLERLEAVLEQLASHPLVITVDKEGNRRVVE